MYRGQIDLKMKKEKGGKRERKRKGLGGVGERNRKDRARRGVTAGL